MTRLTRQLRVRRWVTVLALLATATFAGCSGGDNGAGEGGSVSASGGSSGTGAGGTATGGAIVATGGGSSATGGAGVGTGGANTGAAGAGVGTGGADAAGGASSATGGSLATPGGAAGSATGGSSSSSGGANGGAAATGGSAGSGQGGGAAGSAPLGVVKDAEVKLTSAGLTGISFGGYMNGESFQQEGVLSFNGYQYTAFWNSARHVVLGRRALPTGAWTTIEFTDYTNTESDAHNTISLGICPGDGTLHVSFDHHVSPLHYRKSVAGLVTNPATATWATSSFSAVTSNLLGNTRVTDVTYPRFITEPDGSKMLLVLRIGVSGSGDEYLWEYDSASHAWTSLGMFINGTADSVYGYLHGISYAKGGKRLHTAWCWRDTNAANTNHDLLYAYSDDNGRTWNNNAGTLVARTGSSFIKLNSSGIKVWTIAQNRGLLNSEHMAVDSTGRVHVISSHMTDAQASDSNFDNSRTKTQYFHYWRNGSGTWTRTAMGVNSIALFRGKLAISSTNNLYAVLPDLNLAAASPTTNFASWTVLSAADAGRFFSDPLIDSHRLLTEDKLTVFYPEKGSANIYMLDFTLK